MTKECLKQYRAITKELEKLENDIDKLREQASGVPMVIGRVTGSSHDFPYIQQHIAVREDDPKEADAISKRIKIKQRKKEECEKLSLEIEQFIQAIPDSTDRQIFEMAFLDGMKLKEVGEQLGYSKGRISQKINAVLK